MKLKIQNFGQTIMGLSWKKKIFFGILILIVGGIIFKTVRGSNPNYSFDTVTRSTITEVVTETGNVAVSGEYDVPSPSNGILSDLFVKNGDEVTKGQKLFTVTSMATPQQKAAAWAAYAASKSALDAANAGLFSLQSAMYNTWKTYTDIAENSTYQNPDNSPNNNNRVLTPFTIAQDNWLAAEANYKNQQSVIAQAQASANNTYLAYQATQDSTVVAPISGKVYNLAGIKGSVVSAQSAADPTITPVLILVSGSTYTVKTSVNEVDINKLKIGDTLTITFDGIQGKTYHGKIVQADQFGTKGQGLVNYNVYASVDDANALVKSGMTANLSIETNKRENVLTVINAAVRPYKGAKAVQMLDKKGKVQYMTVTTGLKGLDRTEITSGVSVGDKVIIGNTSKTPAILSGQ